RARGQTLRTGQIACGERAPTGCSFEELLSSSPQGSGQDLASSVAAVALQEYKQGNQADRRTPELCCPSVECQRRSSRAWLPIATSFAETRGLPTSAVISLDSFLAPTKPYKGSMTCKSGTPRALAAGRCMPRCSKPSGMPRR